MSHEARIIVRDNGRFTDTAADGEPNQYAIAVDEQGLFLRLLPRAHWHDNVIVMDVASRIGRATITR